MSTVTTAASPARSFEYDIRIDAPTADVWAALSDGAELRRWFPIDARVKPGVGGSIFLSWGPACEGEGMITLWDPGRALGWLESHQGDGKAAPVKISVQFVIQPDPSGAGTILKVVHFGFGPGAKWEDMYDSIASGWKFELRSLRHYLTRHKGQDRAAIWKPVPAQIPAADAWRKLAAASPAGVLKRGSLLGWKEGDTYEFTGPDDRVYRGIVLRSVPDKAFAGTVANLDDAVLRFEVERTGAAASMPCFWISIWGQQQNVAAPIAETWENAMKRVLGS